ncbi:hypothetical protein BDQ12DRAFT_732201 [Crucibulum laeve]|uniref:DUF4211 domain-containing protein n=1 Tax=Crucibulum laeve TaxID=68775 RepID=A0A5C3MCB9_9AGAR|nr:hypothetical protein BDQ12DRAFT_732201 [Crucibulum laeve]
MPPRKKPQQSKAKLLKQTTLLDAKLPVIQSPAKLSQARPSPAKRRKRNSHASQMPHPESDNDSDSSHMKAIKFAPPSPIEISDNEEDEESVPAPSISKKRKAIILDSDSDVESKGDSNCLPRRKRLMKHGIARKKVQRSEDESSEEEEANTCRRHLVKGERLAKAPSSEDGDMAEEVEQERILKTRLRTRGKKSVYQKNLDKLKRRKEGKPEESPSSSSSSDEESSSSEVEPFKGARPSSDHDSLFDEDSDAPSDFIVEDDGTEVAQLPTQFSMESHQDLSHQFKKIFQFFVRVAVHPGDERHAYMAEQMRCEEYFSVPLQVTRRKISGLRDSLVASSVWRPEYKLALQKHPEFELAPLDFAIPFCDACHLGGRMSTLVGRVSGSPYDSIGFEDQKDSSDSEGDSDDKEEVKTEFHLGRFCARRTRVYHEFLHWEASPFDHYALFKTILREVDEIRSHKGTKKGFTRVAYAGGKQPPEDLTDADGICDWLDERSIIESEWQKIKGMMESARNLEMVAKRGDPDTVL